MADTHIPEDMYSSFSLYLTSYRYQHYKQRVVLQIKNIGANKPTTTPPGTS